MKRVAILGAGPAGLMAAHAAAVHGDAVSLFTQGNSEGPTKSRIGGAQYLHQPLPGICNEDQPSGTLQYFMAGTPEGYRQKVYGDADVAFVSAERIPSGEVPAWSLQETYETLWGLYCSGSSVNVAPMNPETLIELFEKDHFDLVVSTIPKPALCLAHAGMIHTTHTFVSQSVRIANKCAVPTSEHTPNTILYDGTKNTSWYRTSYIFGHGSTEWGAGAPAWLPYENLVTVKKPLHSTCNCFDGKVLFTGRYGAWRKGVLAHEAFKDVWEALS